ncbi:hypothetical protein MDUV_19860 [Mycolicibacterium duvalii]|uniref:Uncharacterized protein n=1 Tax=Mycolicibacterium duvalii TaxID=39688 RepID=A0A7I7JZ15_9MYCO|nr:hypothetical protein MDUV_19860 [Mycolicibacterium duvalii]
MLAVRIEHVHRTLQVPEGDEVDPEIVQADHIALGDISAPADLKPTGRLHAGQAFHVHVHSFDMSYDGLVGPIDAGADFNRRRVSRRNDNGFLMFFTG